MNISLHINSLKYSITFQKKYFSFNDKNCTCLLCNKNQMRNWYKQITEIPLEGDFFTVITYVYWCFTYLHCLEILNTLVLINGRFSKNVQIYVTEFYLLEKALNSNWKWFYQTQHNVMNKRDFYRRNRSSKKRVLRKICLNPPKCHKIACNSAAIATLNVISIMHGRVKLNKTYPTYLDYCLL